MDRTDEDWVHIVTRPGVWLTAGGAENLAEVLYAFVRWVECEQPSRADEGWSPTPNAAPEIHDYVSETLKRWYVFNCSGFWEHCYGLTFSIEAHEQWKAQIDLYDTIAEEVSFKPVDATLSGGEHYRCWVEDCVFHGKGTKFTLEAMCRVFCDWVAPLLAEASNE